MRLIFLKDHQTEYTQRVVLDVVAQQEFPDIKKGAVEYKTFDPIEVPEQPDRVVLSIVSEDGKQIYQSFVLKELVQ